MQWENLPPKPKIHVQMLLLYRNAAIEPDDGSKHVECTQSLQCFGGFEHCLLNCAQKCVQDVDANREAPSMAQLKFEFSGGI